MQVLRVEEQALSEWALVFVLSVCGDAVEHAEELDDEGQHRLDEHIVIDRVFVEVEYLHSIELNIYWLTLSKEKRHK